MKTFTTVARFILCLFIMNILSCKKEYSCEDCNNQLPIADAGADQIIELPNDKLVLDGSASQDPDGSIESFHWRKIAGPASFNIAAPTTAKTKIENLNEGVYQFELKITDNKGLSSKDTVEITVKPDASPNHAPFARTRGNVSLVVPSTSFLLNHTAILEGDLSSDPDNDIVEYFWRQISGPAFSMDNPNAVNIKLTNLSEGIAVYELKVTDSRGLYSKDTAQVKIVIR